MALLSHLRALHQDLHRAQQDASATTSSRSSSEKKPAGDRQQMEFEASTVPVLSAALDLDVLRQLATGDTWHLRMFLDSSEARNLCLVAPSPEDHRIVDGNRLWCEQSGKPRDQLIGRPMRDVMAPVSWQRYKAGITRLIPHGAWMLRNAPVYSAASTADVLAWVEYEDGTSHFSPRHRADDASFSPSSSGSANGDSVDDEHKQRVPKYVHTMNLNIRPWPSRDASAAAPSRLEPQYAVLMLFTSSGDPGERISVFPWKQDGSDVNSRNANVTSMTRTDLARVFPAVRDLDWTSEHQHAAERAASSSNPTPIGWSQPATIVSADGTVREEPILRFHAID